MAEAISIWERIGFRRAAASARPAGAARWSSRIVSLIYFLPVLFIIFTAIKPQALALSVPPTLSPTSLFGLIPEQFVFTPTLENFGSVFSRVDDGGRAAGSTGFDRFFFNSILIASALGAARPRHRHAGGLRLLALSAQGQRHLSLHHPDHPHAAGDRRHHPGDPDVPRRGAVRLLSRHHPALHRLQSAPSPSG